MKVRYITLILVALLIVLFLSGCSTSTMQTPGQSDTTITVSSTPEQLSPTYTYALIGSGQGMGDSCVYKSNKSINISVYPFHKVQKTLSEPGSDFWGARLSPDRQWVAIIKSSPKIIPDNLSFDSIPPDMQLPGNGTASIWLMRPDGSDLHQVSDDVPGNYQAFITGKGYVECEISAAVQTLDWLPDSQSLVFVSRDMGKFSYYSVDIKSRTTRLLMTSDYDLAFLWLPGRNELWWDTEENAFRVSDLAGQNVQTQLIPYVLPEGKTRQEYDVGWHTTKDPDLLFVLIWGNTTATMNYRAAWQYHLKTQEWKKLAEYNPYSPFFTIVQHRLYTFDLKAQTIGFHDTLDWEKSGIIKIPAQIAVEQIIDAYTDDGGNEWVILEGTETESKQRGIWGLSTWIESDQPELILDFSVLKIDEPYFSVLIP